jgi:hypothetical protein
MSENNLTQAERVKKLTRAEREDVTHRAKARQIVQEIMNFGVSQSQIVYIIRMLALELEDVALMNSLNEVIATSERFATEAVSEVAEPKQAAKIYT